MSAITLVLGGARSGKSAFAEQLAGAAGEHVLYIATAQGGDPEMDARIAAHRARRPPAWRTVEAAQDPALALASAGPADCILLDSVTLWLSRLYLDTLLGDGDSAAGQLERATTDARGAIARLLAQDRGTAPLILVSDEVGLGLVPETVAGRDFRDLLGQANQQLAAEATCVFLVTAGIPLQLKGRS